MIDVTKEQWVYEKTPEQLRCLYGRNFGIYKDDNAHTPVCLIPASIAEKQSESLLQKQEVYAKLIAAAPDLLRACIEALKYVCVEDSAHEMLKNAIEKCKVE